MKQKPTGEQGSRTKFAWAGGSKFISLPRLNYEIATGAQSVK